MVGVNGLVSRDHRHGIFGIWRSAFSASAGSLEKSLQWLALRPMEAGKARVILLGLLFVVLFIVFSKSESRSVEHFEPVDDEQLVARGSELVLPPAPAPAPAPPPPAAVACQSCSERPLEDRDANPIWTWIQSYENGPGIHKYHQYLDSYHRHFAQYRSSKQDKIYMAEVGVQSGGSIEMWRNYFGADRLV